MVPLATPRNGELLNLSQIVQVKSHPAGRCRECETDRAIREADTIGEPDERKIVHKLGDQSACTVYFSDGRSEIYSGDASKFLNIELHFLLNMYRGIQQAAASNIVGPDGQKPGLVM